MTWLTRILPLHTAEQRSVTGFSTLKNPTDWFFKMFGYDAGGVVVNQDTAMKLGAFWACVERWAEGVGSLPLFVFEKMNDGSRRVAIEHPNYFPLHSEPNPLYSSLQWRMASMAQVKVKGNSYSIIERDGNRRGVRLTLIDDPDKVEVIKTGNQIFYQIEGYSDPLPADQVFHIHGLGFDGLKGMSAVRYHAETIGSGLNQNKYSNQFYKNSAKYSGVFESDGFLDKAAREKFRESIKAYEDEKAGGAPILPFGIKFKPISIPQKDAEFIATKVKNVEEVARIMNVPLPLIQSHENSTSYNSIEQLMLMWVLHSLRPVLVNWEMEINRKLFRADERGRFYAEFNVNGLLRGDMKSRTEFYKTLWQMGGISGNQIADLENMPRYEGGDKRFAPLNMIPLDKFDDYIQNLINKNNAQTGNQNDAGNGRGSGE